MKQTGTIAGGTPAIVDQRAESGGCGRLERDDFSSNRHLALCVCLRVIFSENRYPLFRIML
jgi:hypothetical protein